MVARPDRALAPSGPEGAPALVQEAPPVPDGRVDRGAEYAELTRILRDAGLLERRRGYYAAMIAAIVAVFAAAAVAFVAIGDSWWAVALAPVFAVVFAHSGFIGHDAGHRQICHGAAANDAIGYVAGNLVIGLGYGQWRAKHNAHHANPNHEDHDPDVRIPVLAFSPDQAVGRRGLAGFVTRHQAALFVPLLLLEGFSMHVHSVTALVSGSVRAARLEAALLVGHVVLYLGAVFTVLSPGPGVVFVLVHQALFGLYLGAVFAPNHKGMPMISAADRLDPVRKQVLTSRNIAGSVLTDHAMGALNHQIEHHLFPRMPRPSLRRAQPLVEAFCARQDIAYLRTGLVDSYARGLHHLHDASSGLRAEHAAIRG